MAEHRLHMIGSVARFGFAADWLFVCSCGEVHQHPQRRAAYTKFAVHAHTENKRDGQGESG